MPVEDKVQAIRDWCENVAHMTCVPDMDGNPDYKSKDSRCYMYFYLYSTYNEDTVLFTVANWKYDSAGIHMNLYTDDVEEFLKKCTAELVRAALEQ